MAWTVDDYPDPPSDYWTECDMPELTDDESLFATIPPDEDWSEFYRASITEPGVVRGSRYQQVSEDVAEVVG